MQFKYVNYEYNPAGYAVISFTNPNGKNVINIDFINEINAILDELYNNENCKAIVLKGRADSFCIGMDFGKVNNENSDYSGITAFITLMNRLHEYPTYILSVVEGEVMAGGMGLIAVSDYVISKQTVHYSLPEAIWGLLPAVVFPYLSLKIGFNNAKKMTVLFNKITAEDAFSMGIADELSEMPELALKKVLSRLIKIRKETIRRQKEFFCHVNKITPELTDYISDTAICQMKNEQVIKDIELFLKYGKFSWEK